MAKHALRDEATSVKPIGYAALMTPPSHSAASPAIRRLAVALLLVPLGSSIQGCCFSGGSHPSSSSSEQLVDAARKGESQRVRELLDAGVSPSSIRVSASGGRLGSSMTAVEAAVDSGTWEAIEPLLVDEEQKTSALLRAFQRTNLDIAQRLVQKGAKPDPSWAFDLYTRALKVKSRSRAEGLVKLLLELGMDPNATWRGQNAYSGKYHPVVVFVVSQSTLTRGKNADTAAADTVDTGKSSDLDGYYISPWAPEVFILLTRPQLDAPDDEGMTALMSAAVHGDDALVRFLLKQGADPARVDKQGRDAAWHAAQLGHKDLATLLHGPLPNVPR